MKKMFLVIMLFCSLAYAGEHHIYITDNYKISDTTSVDPFEIDDVEYINVTCSPDLLHSIIITETAIENPEQKRCTEITLQQAQNYENTWHPQHTEKDPEGNDIVVKPNDISSYIGAGCFANQQLKDQTQRNRYARGQWKEKDKDMKSKEIKVGTGEYQANIMDCSKNFQEREKFRLECVQKEKEYKDKEKNK
jgi:hypothetical protein